jgi:hypothetical protein
MARSDNLKILLFRRRFRRGRDREAATSVRVLAAGSLTPLSLLRGYRAHLPI